MVNNKKGVMKIVEATIAVILILGALLIISSQRDVRIEEDLTDSLYPLLDEIALNDNLRRDIILGVAEDVEIDLKVFLDERITNPVLDYSVRVCDLGSQCPLVPFPSDAGDIFSAERVVSTIVEEGQAFEPKKVRIFLWKLS